MMKDAEVGRNRDRETKGENDCEMKVSPVCTFT